MNQKRISQSSDDGYSSDGRCKTPEKTTATIVREDEIFRSKYIVHKLINNSANGVIYSGKSPSFCANTIVYYTGPITMYMNHIK